MKFSLNEALLFKVTFSSTLTSSAMRRSVRPFMKAINKAIEEAQPEYEKIRESYKEEIEKGPSKERQEEIMAEMSKKATEINSKIFVDIDFTRNSTKNFFITFWSPFQWDQNIHGQTIVDIVDQLDEKVCEAYPELNVDVDKEETE